MNLTTPKDAQQSNLYDRMFDQLCGTGVEIACSVEAVVDAYLDGKPTTRGKHKYSRYERDADFWRSQFVGRLPLDAWSSEQLTLALSRYFGQERVASPPLLERIATASPQTVKRAVR